MKPLNQDESLKLYQMTGMDIDGRREMVLSHLRRLEDRIRLFVSFAKNLPGFPDLPMDDQISLMKSEY